MEQLEQSEKNIDEIAISQTMVKIPLTIFFKRINLSCSFEQLQK